MQYRMPQSIWSVHRSGSSTSYHQLAQHNPGVSETRGELANSKAGGVLVEALLDETDIQVTKKQLSRYQQLCPATTRTFSPTPLSVTFLDESRVAQSIQLLRQSLGITTLVPHTIQPLNRESSVRLWNKGYIGDYPWWLAILIQDIVVNVLALDLSRSVHGSDQQRLENFERCSVSNTNSGGLGDSAGPTGNGKRLNASALAWAVVGRNLSVYSNIDK